VLRKISGPQRGDVTGSRRKLNEELHKMHSSKKNIRDINSNRMRCVGHIACTGKMRNSHKILVGKTEGKRQLKRPDSRW
jgi:hypothetical protein